MATPEVVEKSDLTPYRIKVHELILCALNYVNSVNYHSKLYENLS